MTAPTFLPGNPLTHRQELVELNIEYLDWVLAGFSQITGVAARDMLGMETAPYVEGAIVKVCSDQPPRGIFYLVYCDGALAGMGGLRYVRAGVAEIKRIYVRAAFRGRQLGEAVLQRLLDDAKSFGYQTVVLDSAPFMQSAQQIYVRHGFVDRGPYDEVEAPKELHSMIRFMEKTL